MALSTGFAWRTRFLAAGLTLNQTLLNSGPVVEFAAIASRTTSGATSYDWASTNSVEKLLGFFFYQGANLHAGWLRLKIGPSGGGAPFQATVDGMAYNTIPVDQPGGELLIGDAGVPEPGSLAYLAAAIPFAVLRPSWTTVMAIATSTTAAGGSRTVPAPTAGISQW